MPICVTLRDGDQVLIGDTLVTMVKDRAGSARIRVESDDVPVTRGREILWKNGVPDHPESIKAAVALRNTIWDKKFNSL